MVVAIILCALVLQRFCKCYSQAVDWKIWQRYFAWVRPHATNLGKHNVWLTLAIVEVPLVVFAILLTLGASLLLGRVGVSIVELIVLWFCIDLESVTKLSGAQDVELPTVISRVVERVFSPIFWFFCLGIIGVVLYASLLYLSEEAQVEGNQADVSEEQGISTTENISLQKLFTVFRKSMDWLPAQFLLLTVGLLQKFPTFIKAWLPGLKSKQLPYAELAQSFKNIPASVLEDKRPGMPESRAGCIDRAFLIWLGCFLVIRLITLL